MGCNKICNEKSSNRSQKRKQIEPHLVCQLDGKEVGLLRPGDPEPEADAHGDANDDGGAQGAVLRHATLDAVLEDGADGADSNGKKK